ncbi:hypothetical protein [Sulfurimonas sp.]|uniref:hypothetical protein n=1 Tax=Sulfurimonas sp. TaxID=2022749 RepID=UPI002B47E403|nr:hypothetical protein [Sulfurimonas sp.]
MYLKTLLLYILLFSVSLYSSIIQKKITSPLTIEKYNVIYKPGCSNYKLKNRNTLGGASQGSCINAGLDGKDFISAQVDSIFYETNCVTENSFYISFEVYSSSTILCKYASCKDGLKFNTKTELCEAPPKTCKDKENQVLNPDTNICDCADGYVKKDDDCLLDTDGDGDPDITDPDKDDPDITSGGGSPDGSCKGFAQTKHFFPNSPKFPYSDYKYLPYYKTIPECKSLVSNKNKVDSIFYVDDKGKACERSYCFAHYKKEQKCTSTVKNSKPAGFVYMSNLNKDECYAKVDGISYTKALYFVADSLTCPNIEYCFLKPKKDLPDNPSPDNNTSTNPLPNKKLNSIDSKIKITNDKLTDLNNKATDRNNKLNDLNNKAIDRNNKLGDIIKNTSTSNKSLKSIDEFIKSNNKGLTSLNETTLKNNSQFQNIASNTRNINENLQAGLLGDDPFANVDLTDDGSSKFGDFKSDVSSAFDKTTYFNIFGLSGMSGGSIPEYSANIMGSKITVFHPSMLNGFPMADIRALIMFFFALMGFIHTFRSV